MMINGIAKSAFKRIKTYLTNRKLSIVTRKRGKKNICMVNIAEWMRDLDGEQEDARKA